MYNWTPPDFKNSPSLPNPRVNPDSTIRYFLTVTDSNSCSDKDSVLMTVIKPPITTKVDTTICSDEQIQLNAKNNGFSYFWSVGSVSQSTVVDTGKHFVVLSNSCFSDTSFFRIKGRDCNPIYYIPSGFSPNGDGLNDVFRVESENIAHVKMTIYNRWGEVLFDEQGKSPAWDGTFKERACMSNQYLYIIELQDIDGKKYNEKGTITLLR